MSRLYYCATTLLLLSVLTAFSPCLSQPILSVSTATATLCTSPTTATSCSQCCPLSVPLSYPTPTTAVSCSQLPSYVDSSVYYSYTATNYSSGIVALYRSVNSSVGCSAAAQFASLTVGGPTQCSNTTALTQAWQLTGGINSTSSSVTLLTANNTSPAVSCPAVNSSVASNCTNCTASLLSCPASNTTTATATYQLLSNFTLTTPCPPSCNTSIPLWVSSSALPQCLSYSLNVSAAAVCECYDFAITQYQISGCYSDAASQSYLANLTAIAAPYCAASAPPPSSSSSSSSSSTGSGSGSTPAAGVQINESAIIGGVIGGAVGIVLLILILRCCMRMQAKGQGIQIHRRTKSSSVLESQLKEEGEQLQRARDLGDDKDEDDEEDDGDEEDDMDGDDEQDEDEDVDEAVESRGVELQRARAPVST